MAKLKNDGSYKLTPQPEKECYFRGVRFFTRNLGAIDEFHGRFVWFAVGEWSYEGFHGVSNTLLGAIAGKFELWEELGLAYSDKFKTPEQLKKLELLKQEILAETGIQTH